MLTHRDPTLTTGVLCRLALPAALAAVCVALVAALSLPADAEAKTHSFRALKVKNGVATFKLKKKVAARDIRSARVLSKRGSKRVSLRRVRKAARRGYLRVRVARRARSSRALTVRAKRRLAARRRAARLREARLRRERKQGSTKPAPAPAPAPAPSEPLPSDPTLVIETPDPSTAPGGGDPLRAGLCTTDLAGVEFSSTNRPPACWRPFADTSPFNQPIPGGARLAPDSATVVSRLREAGSAPKAGRANMPEGSDYHKGLFWASSTDPQYTVRGGSTTAPYDIDGRTLRLPDGARAAPGGDAHMGVIYNGEEWCFYHASVDTSTRTITVDSGRRIPLTGDGRNSAATSARFGCLAGTIRYQELEAGQINHAVFMTASTTSSSYVYPAQKSDGPKGSGYPPMGMRFQLDPSYATDAWLAQFPAWKRAILRALRDYGGYLGDTTGSGWTVMSLESEVGYHAVGQQRPFAAYASARDASDPHISQSGGTYYFNLESGVDWSRLRTVDPCVAERTC